MRSRSATFHDCEKARKSIHRPRSPTVRKVDVPIARVPIFSTLLFATFDSRKRRENDRISLSWVEHYARSYELVLNSHERCKVPREYIGVALPPLRCERNFCRFPILLRIFAYSHLLVSSFAILLHLMSQAFFRLNFVSLWCASC